MLDCPASRKSLYSFLKLFGGSLCTDVSLPEKKSLLPIFSEGGGTSVHRLFEGRYLIFIGVDT